MAKLDLPTLQAMVALGGYGGQANLSVSTSLLGLSAATFLSNLDIWQGAGYYLTEDEIDEIDELVDRLQSELMNTGELLVLDNCKAQSLAPIAIPHNTSMFIPFDWEEYDNANMHDKAVNNDRIYVNQDGLHLINCNIQWDFSTVGRRTIQILRWRPSAFTSLAISVVSPADGSYEPTQFLTVPDQALVGDYYTLRVKQTSGGVLDILNMGQTPYFAVSMLSG
jgi:hypothetical protein